MIVEVADLSDPALSDYAHATDVALRKARGAEHGLYLAESALVLRRALDAGHRPRSVLALASAVDEAVALVGDEVPVYTGPDELLADPTNVGAIFRSVAAIGADAVLVTPRCSDPFYRRSIRVSMGTVLQVPWTRVGDWAMAREQLAGFHIAALALTAAAAVAMFALS